jgi:hypothetical protein
LVATLAGLATATGAALLFAAVVTTRRLWFGGYVSEAGVASESNAGLYRAGVLTLAAGLVLLAVAVGSAVPAASLLLAASGLLAGVSGAVSCTAGCPLPPYEPTTVTDMVHAVASVLAVGGCALAMGAVGIATRVQSGWRRLSMVAFWVVGLLIGVAAVAMLGLGRGYATGLLERVILLLVTAWLLATSAYLARRPT